MSPELLCKVRSEAGAADLCEDKRKHEPNVLRRSLAGTVGSVFSQVIPGLFMSQ